MLGLTREISNLLVSLCGTSISSILKDYRFCSLDLGRSFAPGMALNEDNLLTSMKGSDHWFFFGRSLILFGDLIIIDASSDTDCQNLELEFGGPS